MRSEQPGTEDSATEMAEENLKINVFIADEKYAILIPRNEHQSDEEEIIRRSAKRVNDAIRELESVEKALRGLEAELGEEVKRINEYIEKE